MGLKKFTSLRSSNSADIGYVVCVTVACGKIQLSISMQLGKFRSVVGTTKFQTLITNTWTIFTAALNWVQNVHICVARHLLLLHVLEVDESLLNGRPPWCRTSRIMVVIKRRDDELRASMGMLLVRLSWSINHSNFFSEDTVTLTKSTCMLQEMETEPSFKYTISMGF